MDIQMGMSQAMESSLKLNDQIKVLNSSTASIKMNQGFAQSIKASYSSMQELKAETDKIQMKSSLVASMEVMKAKAQETKSTFKEISKIRGVKESIEEQNNSLSKFIQDIRSKKLSIKAVIDISKESIQKISNSFNFSANMQMSSSIEISIPEESLSKAQEGIGKSLKDNIKGVIDTLKGLKIESSFTDTIKQIKEWLGDIKTLFKGMFSSDEGKQSVENQAKHFVKLREEVERCKQKIMTLKSKELRIEVKAEKKAIDVAKKNIETAFSKLEANIEESKFINKVINLKNSARKQFIGFTLGAYMNFILKTESIRKITSSISGFCKKTQYITLAAKDLVKEKIEKLQKSKVLINAIAKTELAKDKLVKLGKMAISPVLKVKNASTAIFNGLKSLGTKVISPIIKAKDGTKAVIEGITKRISGLSKLAKSIVISPISMVKDKLVSPMIKDQKEQIKSGKKIPESHNAVAQIERVQKSMAKLKTSVFNALMPILVAVLKPIANWVEKNQPKIDAFIQKISAKIMANAPKIQAVVTSVMGKISNVIAAIAPVVVKIVGTICRVVSNMKPTFQKIFAGIGSIIEGLKPVFDKIIDTVKFLGQVWMDIWPTISKILQTSWAIIKPIFSTLQSVASIIVDIFKLSWPYISSAIEGVWNFIEPILNFMAGALEKVSKVAGWVADKFSSLVGGGSSSSGKDKGNRHAYGMSRVPYDDYPALLHEGEKVLTKQEANSSRGIGGISIAKLAETIVVREEADIDKITTSLVTKLQKTGFNMA